MSGRIWSIVKPSGSGVDLTAPGPIGGGTPSTGAFTGLTLPNQALTAGLAPTVSNGIGTGFAISGGFGIVVTSTSGGDFFGVGYSTARLGSAAALSWVNGASVRGGTFEDLILRRAAAATLQLGTTHATTPTDQTICAHGVTTGAGADLILKGGTGDGIEGSQLQLAGGSSSSAGNIYLNGQDITLVGAGSVVLQGSNRGAHIIDAYTSHSLTGTDTVSQADVESALDNLGTTINSILAALESHGLLATF